MSMALASLPRLERVHAGAFAAGIVALLIGILFSSPAVLVLSGVCLVLTGLMIFAGVRITLHGPLGDALRLALGRRRLITVYLRGAVWIALGLALTALALQAMYGEPALPLGPRIAA